MWVWGLFSRGFRAVGDGYATAAAVKRATLRKHKCHDYDSIMPAGGRPAPAPSVSDRWVMSGLPFWAELYPPGQCEPTAAFGSIGDGPWERLRRPAPKAAAG